MPCTPHQHLITKCVPTGNQTLVGESSSGVRLTTGPKVEVTGDAIVNNRKNKLIPSYELEITGSWTGVQHAKPT